MSNNSVIHKITYGPSKKRYFYSKDNLTRYPNPVISNNILNQEFNYTYDCDNEIFEDDYLNKYF